jgi:hypothetical protein
MLLRRALEIFEDGRRMRGVRWPRCESERRRFEVAGASFWPLVEEEASMAGEVNSWTIRLPKRVMKLCEAEEGV